MTCCGCGRGGCCGGWNSWNVPTRFHGNQTIRFVEDRTKRSKRQRRRDRREEKRIRRRDAQIAAANHPFVNGFTGSCGYFGPGFALGFGCCC